MNPDQVSLDWLARFSSNGGSDSIVGRPYRIEIDGELWTFATDGSQILAVQRDLGAHEFMEAGRTVGTNDFIRRHLKSDGSGVPVDGPGLRAWLKANIPTCEACGGTNIGEMVCGLCGASHECVCVVCKMTPRGVYLGDVAVDAKRLEKVLSLADGPILIALPETANKPIHISGDGWRAALMPVTGPAKDLPRFGLTVTAGAGAWAN